MDPGKTEPTVPLFIAVAAVLPDTWSAEQRLLITSLILGLLGWGTLPLTPATDQGPVKAEDDVSFDLAPGEVLGLVRESGSGKPVTAKSPTQLNPGNANYDPATRVILHDEAEGEFGLGILCVSLDLCVIARTADRVVAIYLGRLVEEGTVRNEIPHRAHPCAKGLINALPKIEDLKAPLMPVPGGTPSPPGTGGRPRASHSVPLGGTPVRGHRARTAESQL